MLCVYINPRFTYLLTLLISPLKSSDAKIMKIGLALFEKSQAVKQINTQMKFKKKTHA